MVANTPEKNDRNNEYNSFDFINKLYLKQFQIKSWMMIKNGINKIKLRNKPSYLNPVLQILNIHLEFPIHAQIPMVILYQKPSFKC